MRKTLLLEERLAILRTLDVERKWDSLDDQRICAICHRVFSGRQIEIIPQLGNHYRLRCPTLDCPADVRHWFPCKASPARPQVPPHSEMSAAA